MQIPVNGHELSSINTNKRNQMRDAVCPFFSGHIIASAKVACAKTRFWDRLVKLLTWIGPAVALAALPKCPMCLVGYVALITGAGVSIAVAETMRAAVAVISIALLAWFAVRKFWPAKPCHPR